MIRTDRVGRKGNRFESGKEKFEADSQSGDVGKGISPTSTLHKWVKIMLIYISRIGFEIV